MLYSNVNDVCIIKYYVVCMYVCVVLLTLSTLFTSTAMTRSEDVERLRSRRQRLQRP
eukprot:COSAG01_NODE_31189_length_602_cov_0.711730_1_plen_56_part_10